MRRLAVVPLLFSVLLLTGCPTDKDARDAIAAAHGYIQSAQSQWGDSCRANPAQVKCVSTNKLIAAQHTAADALLVYCSGTPTNGDKPYEQGGPCVPVKTAQESLVATVRDMNALVADVKNLLGKGN